MLQAYLNPDTGSKTDTGLKIPFSIPTKESGFRRKPMNNTGEQKNGQFKLNLAFRYDWTTNGDCFAICLVLSNDHSLAINLVNS